jgi:hypothetical protein
MHEDIRTTLFCISAGIVAATWVMLITTDDRQDNVESVPNPVVDVMPAAGLHYCVMHGTNGVVFAHGIIRGVDTSEYEEGQRLVWDGGLFRVPTDEEIADFRERGEW